MSVVRVDPKAAVASRSEREKRVTSSPRYRDGKFVNTRPTEQLRQAPGLSMAYDFLAGGGARTPKVALPIFDGRGYPVHRRGVSSVDGLYFLGLPWLHTWGSGRFSGVAVDATYLAERIERRLGSALLPPLPVLNELALGS